MPVWTKDQLSVICAKNREILVSAAAGSGKTAVLVERVTELIRNGYKLNRMLIITFTHAAAAEMKEKIRKRLESERTDPVIAAALDSLESSDISTIHSFCQRLIRSQFQAIGKDPTVGICDAAQKKQLMRKAFRNALDILSEEKDIFFEEYRKSYTLEEAEEQSGRLYDFLMSLPDPFGWLKESYTVLSREIGPDHPWMMYRGRMTADLLNEIHIIEQQQEEMFDSPFALPNMRITREKDRELILKIKEILSDPEKTKDDLNALKFPTAVACKTEIPEEEKWKKQYTDLRNDIKKIIRDIAEAAYPDYDAAKKEFFAIGSCVRGLARLTEVMSQEYGRLKNEKHVMDFGDLEHEALKILNQETVCRSVREGYDFIFVDECQDVSSVQDAIIRKIHGEENCLFTVGDVKQSIYRFRRAEPTLFLSRMQSFSDDEDAPQRRIFLQANFRSRPEILETTNIVFRKAMKKNVTELDYEKKDELIPGRVTEGYEPVMIDLIENDREETGISDLEAIADHIVSRGTELLEERYVPEKRNYCWRDMVILMPRVKGDGAKLADLLIRKGVPAYFDGGKEYYEQEEIRSFTNLLNIIDHPWQDIALIGTLRSTPFFFTDDELAEIRIGNKGKKITFRQAFDKKCEEGSELGHKCSEAKTVLNEWRFLSEVLPLGDFMWQLVRESGYYALQGAYPDGALRQANLRILCNQAGTVSRNGILTLHDFLTYMSDMSSGGEQKSAKLLGENDDLIRIMTMHKSKGLQFPVVFCVGIDKAGGRKTEDEPKCHNQLGVCLHYRNPELRIERATYADAVFDWRRKMDERAERLRLLYVAMTRAQEKLFMISCKTSDFLWNFKECDARIMAAETPVDWLIPPLIQAENETISTDCTQPANPWKIKHFDANKQKVVEKEKVFHNLEEWFNSTVSATGVEQLWNGSATGGRTKEYMKTSVTTLIRGAREFTSEPGDPDEDMDEKRRSAADSETIRLSDIPEYPAFMQESEKMSATHRGTVIHHFLSLVDPERIRNAADLRAVIAEEKQRLTDIQIFSQDEKNQIREQDISAFFLSDIGQRMLRSPDVRREWNFNLLVPEEDNLILQGIIDCAFAEGDGWILLDYKTDRNADEQELKRRYSEQLKWYARAISTLTEKPVTEMWIYALSDGKAYRI